MNNTASSETTPPPKAPVSERKATANLANAQRSTGPRTPQGKARSSLNALRHGILARAAFNPTVEAEHRRAEFDTMVAGLAQEFQPQTMSDHMLVQQLAGCYWRLAKVWTFETEAAWRSNYANNLGFDEFAPLERAGMEKLIDQVVEDQDNLFEAAGLGNPSIPTGPSANTILRYQGAISSMLFRTLSMLEKRRKERMAEQKASGEAFEQRDYINEATQDTGPVAAEEEASDAPTAESAPGADLHKRTQKVATDAPLFAPEEGKESAGKPAASPGSSFNRRATA